MIKKPASAGFLLIAYLGDQSSDRDERDELKFVSWGALPRKYLYPLTAATALIATKKLLEHPIQITCVPIQKFEANESFTAYRREANLRGSEQKAKSGWLCGKLT